ncbi:MAG: HAMP domain-containing histidine kinase [Alphaproteobacteria bacterium]|nr:HAMP domain-containing histidine kinase [Alphaproteobacteria bacterium]
MGRPGLAVAGPAGLVAWGMAGVVIWFEGSRAREADRLRRALIDAQAANVAKREFLANISHELRTPLNAIIGFSDLMAAQPFGALNDRYRGYADDIQGAGRHLLSIVNQLLDLAAIEAGRLRLQPETLDPGDVIREVAEMMRAIARERNVRVVEVPPPEAFATIGDRTMLRQIVTNLAGNAVRHCRVNGAVRLAWSQDGAGQYTIAIEDEGPGIPAEDIAHIFEPFWRKESSSLTRRGGTGLGLMITRQFVTRWGGAIAVDSEIGKGSVFTVTLPLRIDALGGR